MGGRNKDGVSRQSFSELEDEADRIRQSNVWKGILDFTKKGLFKWVRLEHDENVT